MDAKILCYLIAKQIDPTKWQLYGDKIHWINKDDDTPENREIIEDIIRNYETYALPLVKRSKIGALKCQMRSPLSEEIGDLGDNITDLTRALILGECIRFGIVTDEEIIKKFAEYCKNMLEGFGGEKAIIEVLNSGLIALSQWVIGRFYPAKEKVVAAQTIKEVEEITL
jgi:hypothetical protein